VQRLFGTEVWAGDNFVDILERPERYDRPCLWHEPIPVARRLALGEAVYWDDVAITVYPMSGHTRFSTLVCLEMDGVRVVHTGDQIFFDPWEFPTGECPPDARLFANHVYKNGLDLGCYRETLAYLRAFRPDWVLTGHTKPYRTNDAWYAAIERGARAFDEVHQALMPLADNDVHFGPEGQAAKLKPYRVHRPGTDRTAISFEAWVLNPFPTAQTAVVRLIAPDGWKSEPANAELGPREQKTLILSLTPPPDAHCRRQPIALDLNVGNQPFGQVTEALVTLGHPYF
jgi:glyoxylase-like metal-dependent hydrolase (beta-lactamase superfamily II)